jgi:hypothetical protein
MVTHFLLRVSFRVPPPPPVQDSKYDYNKSWVKQYADRSYNKQLPREEFIGVNRTGTKQALPNSEKDATAPFNKIFEMNIARKIALNYSETLTKTSSDVPRPIYCNL